MILDNPVKKAPCPRIYGDVGFDKESVLEGDLERIDAFYQFSAVILSDRQEPSVSPAAAIVAAPAPSSDVAVRRAFERICPYDAAEHPAPRDPSPSPARPAIKRR